MINLVAIGLFGILLVSGCASMNDAMTPSASVIKDDFDGKLIVRQSSVSSSSSLSEAWHTLGFEWTQKTPDIVFIDVGTKGITNITDVAFNADDNVISSITPASSTTDYGTWSERRFQMPLSDFIKVATGRIVKMKVVRNNDYTVSSFGTGLPGASVNTKFQPFLAKVEELRSMQAAGR